MPEREDHYRPTPWQPQAPPHAASFWVSAPGGLGLGAGAGAGRARSVVVALGQICSTAHSAADLDLDMLLKKYDYYINVHVFVCLLLSPT